MSKLRRRKRKANGGKEGNSSRKGKRVARRKIESSSDEASRK